MFSRNINFLYSAINRLKTLHETLTLLASSIQVCFLSSSSTPTPITVSLENTKQSLYTILNNICWSRVKVRTILNSFQTLQYIRSCLVYYFSTITKYGTRWSFRLSKLTTRVFQTDYSVAMVTYWVKKCHTVTRSPMIWHLFRNNM